MLRKYYINSTRFAWRKIQCIVKVAFIEVTPVVHVAYQIHIAQILES